MTRGPYPGWSLVEDGYLDEPEPVVPEPPRRFGCLSVAVLLLVLVAGISFGGSHETRRPGVRERSLAALGAAAEPAVSSVRRSVDGAVDAAGDADTGRIGLADGEVAGAVGAASSLYSASATWCAPTPTQCQGWGGNATLAAVHSFRYGDRPYWVEVEYRGKVSPVLVVSHCACHDSHGYIDLSPYAFEKLAPLSRGRIDVTVRTLDEAPDQSGDDGPEHPDDARLRLEDRALPATSTEDD